MNVTGALAPSYVDITGGEAQQQNTVYLMQGILARIGNGILPSSAPFPRPASKHHIRHHNSKHDSWIIFIASFEAAGFCNSMRGEGERSSHNLLSWCNLDSRLPTNKKM